MKHERIRLHKAVTDLVKNLDEIDYTKPEIQRNIKNYGVFVNGQLIQNRLEWIYPRELLKISHWPQRKMGDVSKIQIVEETKDYLIIHKPIGLPVQPGAGHSKDNVVTWLLQEYPQQKEINSPTHGLAHRIDKDTQGLLLIAKTEPALFFFQEQFRTRTVTKKYLALVTGILDQEIEIRSYQARNLGNMINQKLFWEEEIAIKYSPKYKNARSYFKPLFLNQELQQTLVEIQIFTGRMHQIRVQAEAIGHPLIADKLYNSKVDINIQKLTNKGFISTQQARYKNLETECFQQLIHSLSPDSEYLLISNYLNFTNLYNEPISYQLYYPEKLINQN